MPPWLIYPAEDKFNRMNQSGDTTMFTKTKIALSVALILGAASAALANDKDEPQGGFQVQTWQDIANTRADVENQIRHAFHAGTSGTDYGFVAAQTQDLSRKKIHNR
jgi:hypothetical protein